MAHIGTAYTKGAGYFVNDDRPSGGQKVEDDVRTCPHCQAVILMRKWAAFGGFCRQCNAPVCGVCGKRMEVFGCEPFLRTIEKQFGIAESIRNGLGPPPEPQAIIYGRQIR